MFRFIGVKIVFIEISIILVMCLKDIFYNYFNFIICYSFIWFNEFCRVELGKKFWNIVEIEVEEVSVFIDKYFLKYWLVLGDKVLFLW